MTRKAPNNLLSIIALILVASVVLCGCESMKKDVPYRIGVIMPVTGKKTPEGEEIVAAQRHAINEWVAKVNESGGINGRPVEIIVKDSLGEKSNALLCAKRLLEVDNVSATIFVGWSGMSQAVSFSHNKSRTPLIYYAWSNADEFAGKWVFVRELGNLEAVRNSGSIRPHFSELIISTLDEIKSAIENSGRDKARIRRYLLEKAGDDFRF